MKKSKLTILPAEYKTHDEILQQRDEIIQDNLNNIKNAWSDLKDEVKKIQDKKQRTDRTMYLVCFIGVFACSIALMLLNWGV
tara:strand:+ start:2320 stop:2565 length:246 start_codon:yes stop_codon:yes gene_type:complete